MKNNIYYIWFHHCSLSFEDREYINDVINQKKFKEFLNLRKKLNKGDTYDYLPRIGYVLDQSGNIIDEVDVTRPDNFFKIRACECECG